MFLLSIKKFIYDFILMFMTVNDDFQSHMKKMFVIDMIVYGDYELDEFRRLFKLYYTVTNMEILSYVDDTIIRIKLLPRNNDHYRKKVLNNRFDSSGSLDYFNSRNINFLIKQCNIVANTTYWQNTYEKNKIIKFKSASVVYNLNLWFFKYRLFSPYTQ